MLLSVAKKRINITTAYFNPDKATSQLLQDAANRGVKIEILVPGLHTDQKIAKITGEAKYEALLEAGIHIWHYQRTMLHAKIFSVDGLFACIGSPNFNQRSMRKDDELGLTVFDPDIVDILDGHFRDDLQAAQEIDDFLWKNRGNSRRIMESLVELLEKEV